MSCYPLLDSSGNSFNSFGKQICEITWRHWQGNCTEALSSRDLISLSNRFQFPKLCSNLFIYAIIFGKSNKIIHIHTIWYIALNI